MEQAMSLENGAQPCEVDRFFGEELADSNEVLGTADHQCRCYDVFGAKHTHFYRRCIRLHGNLDLDGLGQALRVKIVRNWKKLHRPTFYDDALFSKFAVSSFSQVPKYRFQAHKTGLGLICKVID